MRAGREGAVEDMIVNHLVNSSNGGGAMYARRPAKRLSLIDRSPYRPLRGDRDARRRANPRQERTQTPMSNILCVLYDDPVDGYPPSYARDGVPKIERYFDGQTTPTPERIDFNPGELLGSVPASLGCAGSSRSADTD